MVTIIFTALSFSHPDSTLAFLVNLVCPQIWQHWQQPQTFHSNVFWQVHMSTVSSYTGTFMKTWTDVSVIINTTSKESQNCSQQCHLTHSGVNTCVSGSCCFVQQCILLQIHALNVKYISSTVKPVLRDLSDDRPPSGERPLFHDTGLLVLII